MSTPRVVFVQRSTSYTPRDMASKDVRTWDLITLGQGIVGTKSTSIKDQTFFVILKKEKNLKSKQFTTKLPQGFFIPYCIAVPQSTNYPLADYTLNLAWR